ncbi:tetratricopeptide repeat-containing sensor histidine kinase [Chitinophaga barathri]|uniref:histidine kinase n=1 Tax=Chitinophaga barathri TaxID=1647451 RepID=A0A3N4M576_9BACT|nr:sensor histidine kinase [Chitinophaga barathri]RPD38332.1 hypothetical protein EG028_25945 [Chitinophaga barathri]
MKTGLLFIFFILTMGGIFTAEQACAQQASSGYSIPLQRMQLKHTAAYVFFCLKGRVDMDSIAIMVSQGENLPYSLYYDEDYREGPDGRVKELLALGNDYLHRSGAHRSDLENAYNFLSAARQEADKTGNVYWQKAALAALGRYYLQNNEPDKSRQCFTLAVDLARKTSHTSWLAGALANRGIGNAYNDPQKETDYNESLKLYRQQKDTVKQIEILTKIYEIHFVQGKFDTVVKQLRHVTELEKLVGFRHIHYNHSVLASLAFYTGSFVDIFREAKTAVEIMETNGDYAFSNFIYSALANAYAGFDNYEKALYWLNKGFHKEGQNVSKRIWYDNFYNVTLNISKYGHPQQALDAILPVIKKYPPVAMHEKMHIAHVLGYSYHDLNQLDLSEKYYTIMLPYLDSLRDDPGEQDRLFSAYMDLALFRITTGQTGLAREYSTKARMIMDSSQVFQVKRVHWVQYKLDSSTGNYLGALAERYAAGILEDSVFNMRKTREFTEMQVQYQTESQEKNIQLLEQKDKARLATLQRTDLIKNFTLAGILAMILVTVLVYIQYRNKQKSNEQIQEKNLELEQLVKDKEWLVKEIHHRVKNNFHIVASLLEIQSSYLKNKEALSAIKESQNRIHSMSIIHQKLYQSETFSTIHMPEYIYELVEYLRESYAIRQNILFDLQVENIELNHSSAITLGLILNEAITNAIKYAFPEQEDGKISISLSRMSGSQILLSISDNGRGLPQDFGRNNIGASMGMELLQGLTDDLGGSFTIQTREGTHINILFSDLGRKTGEAPFKS